MMPLGLLVDPDEKNTTAASLGRTASAVACTSSRGSPRPRARKFSHESIPVGASPTVARWRRNGNLSDCSAPGAIVQIAGSSSDKTVTKSVFSTLRSNSSMAALEDLSKYPSSDAVENVLSVTATPPASETPKTAEIHSGRLVIKTPTRVSLPTPQARNAHATSTALSHSSEYLQRISSLAVRKTSASRSP